MLTHFPQVNHEDRPIYIGSTKDDEMCNFYLMYWVDGPGDPISPATCFTQVNKHTQGINNKVAHLF
jgi:hypothetical protein